MDLGLIFASSSSKSEVTWDHEIRPRGRESLVHLCIYSARHRVGTHTIVKSKSARRGPYFLLYWNHIHLILTSCVPLQSSPQTYFESTHVFFHPRGVALSIPRPFIISAPSLLTLTFWRTSLLQSPLYILSFAIDFAAVVLLLTCKSKSPRSKNEPLFLDSATPITCALIFPLCQTAQRIYTWCLHLVLCPLLVCNMFSPPCSEAVILKITDCTSFPKTKIFLSLQISLP